MSSLVLVASGSSFSLDNICPELMVWCCRSRACLRSYSPGYPVAHIQVRHCIGLQWISICVQARPGNRSCLVVGLQIIMLTREIPNLRSVMYWLGVAHLAHLRETEERADFKFISDKNSKNHERRKSSKM